MKYRIWYTNPDTGKEGTAIVWITNLGPAITHLVDRGYGIAKVAKLAN